MTKTNMICEKYYDKVSCKEAATILGCDIDDIYGVKDITGYTLHSVCFLVAKEEYREVLANNGFELVELVQEEGKDTFIAQVVNGRVFNIEDEIVEMLS